MPTTQNDINKEEGKGSGGCRGGEIKAGAQKGPLQVKTKLQSRIFALIVQFSAENRKHFSFSTESDTEIKHFNHERKLLWGTCAGCSMCLESFHGVRN